MGCSTDIINTLFQPAQPTVIIKLKPIFLYKSKSYLYQKYVKVRVSCQDIALSLIPLGRGLTKAIKINGTPLAEMKNIMKANPNICTCM